MATIALKLTFGMLMLTGCCSVASAQADGGAFIVPGSRIEAPKGFVEMCSSDATFCAKPASVDKGDPTIVTGALASKDVIAQFSAMKSVRSSPFSAPTSTVRGDVTLASLATRHAVRLPEGAPLDSGAPMRAKLVPIPSEGQAPWISPEPQANMAGAAPLASVAGQTPSGSGSATLQNTSQADSLLRRINEFVNARVAQKTDQQMYGREEVWRRSGVGRRAAGDCEDIAIEKRFQLIGSGFPPEQLYFAVVYERQVGLHTVLIARIEDGDYVLDSRSPYVKRWDHTSYTFVSIQSQNEPMQWHSLSAESLHIAQRQDGSTKAS